MVKVKFINVYQFLVIAICLFSCGENTRDTGTITPQKVPHHLVNVLDPNFKNVQDTVYYKQKPFDGIQFGLYPNGDTVFVKPCLNGLEEGFCKQWYPNRQLAQKRLYISGKREGLHEAWWPDGKPKFNYHFENNEFEGLVKEWYENGHLFKEFHFKKGYEEGSQKLFWINGKARANYVIRNGRRYGLLGTKNCINVADRIFVDP